MFFYCIANRSALLAISFTLSSLLMAEETTIKILVDNSYPPYMYGTQSKAEGLYPTLLREVIKQSDLNMTVHAIPWKRALALSESSQVAVGGLYKNTLREMQYDFSDPIFTEYLWIYVKANSDISFSGFDALKGKNGAINLGWSYGQTFDHHKNSGIFSFEENEDNLTNFKKLITLSRVDFAIVDGIAANQILLTHNYSDEVKKLEPEVAKNYAFIAIAKKYQQRETLEKFNRSLATIKNNGTYQTIIDQYIKPLAKSP